MKVETAGADKSEQGATGREPLAPIIRRAGLPALLAQVLPEIDFSRIEWQPPAPGAFTREVRKAVVSASAFSLLFLYMLGWWTVALLAALLGLGILRAYRYTRTLGWAAQDGAVWFRRGWLWRRTTVARFSKMQIVALHRSPFDRRMNMARLRVDTAGAVSEADRIDIPYLPGAVAADLHQRLSAAASATSFQW